MPQAVCGTPEKTGHIAGAQALCGQGPAGRVSLAGITRIVGVSKGWLQTHANRQYENVPRTAGVMENPGLTLAIECGGLWPFVGKRHNKPWVWLAKARRTGEVVGVHVGDRSAVGAQALWDSLPETYRLHATCHADFWEAYAKAFPPDRHHAAGKDSGKTNPVERFNCTLRQRVSRLVRKSLSFSKKLENPVGAIWYFIHDYNAHRRALFAAA